MEHAQFVHLHNHTEYSLLDGACRVTDEKGRPAELIKTVASWKMPALAITDHGNMFGAIEFYHACTEAGIKPIIGCECYLTNGSRLEKTGGFSEHIHHITLIAKNLTGYLNLMKLSSIGYLEGFYYKPRIDREVLKKYHEGLIGLSGCLKGEIPGYLLKSDMHMAEKTVEEYKDIFGRENFYLEVMNNGLSDQLKVLSLLASLSKRMKVPVVATNDCHYLRKSDADVHDALLCIGTGKLLSDEKRLKFATQEFYYRSPGEMIELFRDMPEAIRATLEITERCSLELIFDGLHLPHYPIPDGEMPDTYLEKLCRKGMLERYGQMTPEIKTRVDYELSIIKKMGFASYFLIVWDFIDFARSQSIPVGPGRGSGAGSIVAYVLGITSICPLKYGLIFERFLNPDRRSMPDLDIDFSDEGRDQVIEYVKEKYGQNNVAQIITFGSMLARSVVRDVGRVMNIPLPEVDKIAKWIPKELGTTLFQALQTVPELKKYCEKDGQIKKLVETAMRLEGLKRHTGVHAAGTVIAKENITSFTPLSRGAKDVITTQYDGETLTRMGLLKVDFLGLRTLTVMEHSEKLIRSQSNPDFTLASIPFDDKKTYKMLAQAQTGGVFQLESAGMRDLLRKLKPMCMNDIIALVSLFRPGPMGSGMLDDYVARRHGRVKVVYDHPLLKPILQETYGVIVYQEQVMRIATELAGLTPGKADDLRKAMGKKIPEVMEKHREEFITGAHNKGIHKNLAVKIFEKMAHFGGYGFNKSHASAYGVLAYQTGYLKANYPIEFMASLLTSEIGRGSLDKGEESKLVQFVSEAESLGLEILPPDVQHSFQDFTIEKVNNVRAVRYGLVALKNVGTGAVASIVQQRELGGPYRSFEDFCSRIDQRLCNRKVMESLIKAGACDAGGNNPHQLRAKLLDELDDIMERTSKAREDIMVGQGSLFDFSGIEVMYKTAKKNNRDFEPWPEHILLSYEKEVLGFYFSGHPLTKYQEDLKLFSSISITDIQNQRNGEELKRDAFAGKIYLAGMITHVRRLVSKGKQQQYARFKLEGLDGEIDVLIFPKSYTKELSQKLVPNEMVVVSGRLNGSDEKCEIIAEDMMSFMEARDKLIQKVIINISSAGLEEKVLKNIKQILQRFPGNSRVYIQVETLSHGRVLLETGITVKAAQELKKNFEKQFGSCCMEIQKV